MHKNKKRTGLATPNPFLIDGLRTTIPDLLFKPNTYGYKKNFWKENLVEKSIFQGENGFQKNPRLTILTPLLYGRLLNNQPFNKN